METFLQDIRYGFRILRKSPGFTAVAVLTLALGIGANTTIFSVVNAVLLRPLPFPDSSRLALLYEGFPTLGFAKFGFSAPDLQEYQKAQRSFLGLAAYQNKDYELSGAGEPQRITGARVTANLFSVLGVAPLLGRSFSAAEDQPGHALAVISYGLWQSKFGKAGDVIGRTINLDRVPYTIVGVMPAEFQFPLRGPSMNNQEAALYIPMAYTPGELSGWGMMYNGSVVGRLRPGVTLEQARTEARLLSERIKQYYPADLMKQFGSPTLAMPVESMHQEVVGPVRPLLLVLQAAVGAVLLIACVNVGLLLLSRASARQREIAVRTALGAETSRLLRQLMAECLALALPGGVLGLCIAIVSKGILLKQLPAGIPLPAQAATDAAVLGFTVLSMLATVLIFGLVPAFATSRVDLRGPLQEGGRSGTTGRARHRLQSAFVVVEFVLALTLMISAGLLLRSFSKLLGANPGFRVEGVLTMTVPLPGQAYPHAQDLRDYYQQAVSELSGLPGVVSASASTAVPLTAGGDIAALGVEGRADLGDATSVRVVEFLGDYLKTMGIPLLRGRGITDADRKDTQPVVLISESMARKLWPHEDALGKRVRVETADWLTVVGIVGDVHDVALSADPMLTVYKSYRQISDDIVADTVTGSRRALSLSLRTLGNPSGLANAAAGRIHRLDPALAVVKLRTMRSEVQSSVAPQRFNAMLLGIYAGLALLLAVIGIYGVLAHIVLQQRGEIGIRMALGAQRRDVLAMVLRRGARLALTGSLLGLGAAWAASRMVASLLYGVSPRDPITFVTVTSILLLAALLACYIPARRATKVDPMIALRYE
jgi:putative ABC transport system permease protein